jgi:hypothetical protein
MGLDYGDESGNSAVMNETISNHESNEQLEY